MTMLKRAKFIAELLSYQVIKPSWYIWRIIVVLCIVGGSFLYLASLLGREVVGEGYFVGKIERVHVVRTNVPDWLVFVKLPNRDGLVKLTLQRPPEPKIGMDIPIKQYLLDDGTEVLHVVVVDWEAQTF